MGWVETNYFFYINFLIGVRGQNSFETYYIDYIPQAFEPEISNVFIDLSKVSVDIYPAVGTAL